MSMEPVLLILCFEHPTNAVLSVGEAMATGLRSHGTAVRVCRLPRDLGVLAQLPPESVSGILSLGSLPLSAQIAGRPLWEHFPAPMQVYLLDALLYDLARVPAMGDFLVAALQDKRLGLLSPEDGYRRWLQPALPVSWGQLAFAAFVHATPFAAPVPAQQRLCVVGNVGNELGGSPAGETLLALLQRLLGVQFARSRLRRLVEALGASDADAMPAVTVCRELHWSPAQALNSRQLPTLIAVDSWVKRTRRIAAVRSLAGVPCDFFGSGWAELLGEVPGFRHVGQIQHNDIAKLLPHYSAIVNFDPNWQHGVHDRVYTAAAAGVAVVTNHNLALAGAAIPADRLALYDARRPDLAGAVREAGWLERRAPCFRVDTEMLTRHGWAARMAGWLGSTQPALPVLAAAAVPSEFAAA